jgi:hypothetical protein
MPTIDWSLTDIIGVSIWILAGIFAIAAALHAKPITDVSPAFNRVLDVVLGAVGGTFRVVVWLIVFAIAAFVLFGIIGLLLFGIRQL